MLEKDKGNSFLKTYFLRKIFIFGVLLSLLMITVPGLAVLNPSFYGMNQANMTLVGDNNTLAKGDYLYLFDTTTVVSDNITGYTWNVDVNPSGSISGPTTSSKKNPVFGPFTGAADLTVDLIVDNDTGLQPPVTKEYYVVDNYSHIRPSYSVKADYRNVSTEYPNGTLTFNDTSAVFGFPMNETVNWWWQATNDSGVSKNASACDNFTVTLSGTSQYSLNLTVKDNNGNLASILGHVGVPPDDVGLVPNIIGVPMSGTVPLNVSFIDLSMYYLPIRDNLKWNWDFDVEEVDPETPHTSSDQNPIHAYTKPGTYYVSFDISDNFSVAPITIGPIDVFPKPIPSVDFAVSPTRGEIPFNVTVISQATGLNDTPLYEWNFGNGTVITTDTPSYVYTYNPAIIDPTITKNYTISHRVFSDGDVFTASNTQNVTVFAQNPPRARFTAYPRDGQAPMNVSFIDQSEGREPFQYEWYFGDNTPKVYEQNPIHVYNNPGVYDVTLMIRAQNGNDIINQTEYIKVSDHSAPIASFVPVPKSGPTPLNVTFIDTSVGNIVKWDWNFGDGNISNEKDPSNIYKYGNYLPILTVTDKDGVTNTTVGDVIRVYNPGDEYEKPIAMFSYTVGEDNLACFFTDESINVPTSRKWDFGDGNISYDRNPVNYYPLFGTYTVTLTVSNPAGANSTEQTIVLPAPAGDVTAGFTVSKTGTRTYKFTDSSTGPILAYYLSYGDGVIDTFKEGWTSYHTYSKMGYYTVSLKVTNGKNSNIVTKKFFVP
jgi:PKD repeat protein